MLKQQQHTKTASATISRQLGQENNKIREIDRYKICRHTCVGKEGQMEIDEILDNISQS